MLAFLNTSLTLTGIYDLKWNKLKISAASLYRSVLRFPLFVGLIIIATNGQAFAKKERYVNVLEGSKGTLVVSGTMAISDSTIAVSGAVTNSWNNYVIFRLNELYGKPGVVALPDSFVATITFTVDYQLPNSSVMYSTTAQTLSINYNKNRLSDIRTVYTLVNAQFMKVTVQTLTFTYGTTANTLPYLILESYMDIDRIYSLNCNVTLIDSLKNTPIVPYSDVDELPVSWKKVPAAEEYDLEWTYIDYRAYMAGFYHIGGTISLPLVFANNATRITISKEQYNIPLLVDDTGYIYYRVRPAQYLQGNVRKTGKWTDGDIANAGRFFFYGHQRNLNWQASTSFAEEGKRKSVVQYFDGSLKNRQTVTKDNTSGTTVVAETLYDRQGRPTIQVLPAPTLNTIIKYTNLFNKYNSAEYSQDAFDRLVTPAATNDNVAAPPMDSISTGAVGYYSPLNPDLSLNANKFIPDSYRYPFTETRYAHDNTGRILAQGGVGPTHQVNGKATRYYYSTPSQEQLDAIFGTEAGYNNYYQKTMVQDANGQFSVSYTDMAGRTVATALAGPEPPSLDRILNYDSLLLIENLSSINNTYIEGKSIISNSSLLVPATSVHSFNYYFNPPVLKDTTCSNSTVCLDCLYDLSIAVFGDSFDTVITKSNVQAGFPDTSCTTSNQKLNTSFSLVLPKGEYSIIKTLTVSDASMNKYREVFIRNNTCQSLQAFINKWTDSINAGTDCALTCSNCQSLLGTDSISYVKSYVSSMGMNADSMLANDPMLVEARAGYTSLKQQCKEVCSGYNDADAYRRIMLMDMMPPSGQYARYSGDHTLDPGYDSSDLSTAPSEFNIYSNAFTANGIAPYVAANYKEENGEPAFIDVNGIPVQPFAAGVAAFIDNFQLSWADALLPYHPEYNRLLSFESYRPGHLFNEMFEANTSYTQAVTKGYINPVGYPSYAIVKDSLFITQPAGSGYQGRPDLLSNFTMNYLINYKSVPNPVSGVRKTISLWQFVNMAVSCMKPGVTADSTCFNTATSSANIFAPMASLCGADKQMAWSMFQKLYLQQKKHYVDSLVTLISLSNNYGTVIPAPAISRFFRTAISDSLMGVSSTVTNEAYYTLKTQQAMDSASTSTCKSYANYWWNQLAPCNITSADKDTIINQLITVCKLGYDSSHPYGASSVNKAKYPTASPASFIAVIEKWAKSNNKNLTTCNGYLIDAPRSYETPVVVGNKPIIEKPDSCSCGRLTVLKTEAVANGYSANFAGYLAMYYKTTIRQGLLDTLIGKCNGTLDPACRYFADTVNLPPVLQCLSSTVCQSCVQIKTLKDTFAVRYPGILTANAPLDSTQVAYQQLFARFMNYNTGFSYSHMQYLLFLDSCGYGGKNQIVADSLVRIYNDFKCYYESLNDSFVNRPAVHPCASIPLLYGPLNTAWNSDPALAANNYLYTPSALKAQIYNGSWNYPFQYDSTYPLGAITFKSGRDMCGIANKFAVETRVMNSRFNPNGTTLAVSTAVYDFGDGGPLGSMVFINDVTPALWLRRNINGIYSDTTISLPGLSGLDTWFTFRYEFTDSMKIISNGNIIYRALRRDNLYVSKINYISIWLQYGRQKKYDYLKVFGSDFVSPIYSENFNDTLNIAYPSIASIAQCPKPDCTAEWIKYFGKRTNNNMSLDGIISQYRINTGRYIDPCSAPPMPMLCGITAPPAFIPIADSACADKVQLATEKGTIAWQRYQDSVNNEFDRLYLSKCLSIAGLDTLTVTHSVAEYHYTLYYYDRAGNLVKTIPPAGVNTIYRQNWLDSVKLSRKNGTLLVPSHRLATNYRYNSLNQVIAQSTPDAGRSDFWYDRLGRLVVSKNAKQDIASPRNYSYTLYDALGRIVEVGQKQNATTLTQTITTNAVSLNSFINNNNVSYPQTEITRTVYDVVSPWFGTSSLDSRFVQQAYTSRNRVSYTVFYDQYTYSGNVPNYSTFNSGTFYNYDIHGNVKQLMNYYLNTTLSSFGLNKYKLVEYDYDLISGKVNSVAYQRTYADQFFHRYSYDAENRITDVYTTTNPLFVGNASLEDHEAYYQYYKHGPLARTVIGQQQVQGVDYAYTLQGWLKGVNSTTLNTAYDMAADGATGNNTAVAKDAFGFSLNYFSGDYKNIKGINPFANIPVLPVATGETTASGKDLFNGNIASMLVNIGSTTPALYGYRYDQLNRLTRKDYFTGLSGTNILTPAYQTAYKEKLTYDPNGNIITNFRNGIASGSLLLGMDDLTYQYAKDGNGNIMKNRLRYVHDQVGAANYSTEDIDSQTSLLLSQLQAEKSIALATDNYQYDSIGNLIKDVQAGISSITWTVYGKIKTITKTDGSSIRYRYDPAGNRIEKKLLASGASDGTTTTYVRDAQGNVMAVYQSNGVVTNSLVLQEQHIYGSSRLGVYAPNVNVSTLTNNALARMRGATAYELSNHLGNVLLSIGDIKSTVLNGANVSSFNANMISYTDYYAFGMAMPGRSFTSGTYRYGFNGKEMDNEVKGTGNQQDYGMRIYDPRLGRFLSVDPLSKSYPQITPYSYAMNRPIDGIDLDGMEWVHYKVQFKLLSDGTNQVLSKTAVQDYRKLSEAQLNAIHKTKSFYSEYSQGFGEKGRGVLYTYEQLDQKGNVVSSKEQMEIKSGTTRHGFYAGQGCITNSGQLLTPGEYGNYDFGMKPIDMGDALAKEHDYLQNIPNHKGFMHTDYLNSDVLFLVKMQKFKATFENDPDYIDPFTGRKVSQETKDFANRSIELFQNFLLLKVRQLGEDLKGKKITQKQYDNSMFMLQNIQLAENGPLPSPNDKLNKDSK